MNPTLGLVGLPGWFWLDGYDGQPITQAEEVTIPPAIGPDELVGTVPPDDPLRQAGTLRVEVRVWPTGCRWDFGDGASFEGPSLGLPYPQESDIQHTHQYISIRYRDGFPVRVTAEFAAEYRVNGGPPEALPPVQREYSQSFRVQQVQSVLVAR
jgi:hypothetical protein